MERAGTSARLNLGCVVPRSRSLNGEAQSEALNRGVTNWDFLRQAILFKVVLLLARLLNQVDTVGILGSVGMWL